MEKSLAFISLWGIVVAFLLMRKSLAPFVRWRNLFILLGVGVFYMWWADIAGSYRIYDALNVLFPGGAYPFHDFFSTQIVVILREEVFIKGVPIFLLLLLLRIFNKGKSMKWVLVFAPLYIANLYAVDEAMSYVDHPVFMNVLGRMILPGHFEIQVVMGYVLYRYCQTRRWCYMPFFALVAAMCIHLMNNSACYMPTEITVYMAANEHYDFLYYLSTICYLVAVALVYGYAIWVGLSLLSQQEGNFLGSRWIRPVDSWIQKHLRKKVYLLIASVLLIGGCMGTAIYFYENQRVRPAIVLSIPENDSISVLKEKEPGHRHGSGYVYKFSSKLEDKYICTGPIDSFLLPMIPLVESGQVIPHKLVSPPLKYRSFHCSGTSEEIRYDIYLASYRGFITYKGIVVGVMPWKNLLTVEERQILK